MEDLYKQYGELMIQAEILQSKIQEIKSQIAQNLNQKEETPKAK